MCLKQSFKPITAAIKQLIGVVLLAVVAWPHAHAQAQFEFSGFASLVASKVITNNNSNQSSNYDAMGKEFSMRDLSLLGLRGNIQLEDNLSLTAQAVVYGYDDYKPRFDWIFASYNLSADWQLSVGRMRTPLFMYSAYQDVSYATPWLSPPYTVYGIPKLMSFDGIKLRYQTLLGGSWSSDVQLWYGLIDEQLRTNDLDGRLRMRNTTGLAWNIERDWLRLHSVYMQGRTSVDLFEQEAISPLLHAIADVDSRYAQRLLWKNIKAHYVGTGISLDFDSFFINSEASYIKIDENIATANTFQSYYLTAGIRPLPKWSFSATINRDRDRGHKELAKAYAHTHLKNTQSNLPSVAEFTKQLEQLQRYDSKGFILTARWDFHRLASAKAEYLAEQRQYGKESKQYRPQAVRFGVDLVF